MSQAAGPRGPGTLSIRTKHGARSNDRRGPWGPGPLGRPRREAAARPAGQAATRPGSPPALLGLCAWFTPSWASFVLRRGGAYRFVEDGHSDAPQLHGAASEEVVEPARGGHQHVHALPKPAAAPSALSIEGA